MDAETRTIFEGIVSLCMMLYGEKETSIIMAEVEEKVAAGGLNGAFLRDWLIHIQQTSIARHPETAELWNSMNLEKTNARTH